MDELIEDELAEETQDDPVAELVASDSSRAVMDATQPYPGEIGFSPLLSAEEEVSLPARRCVVMLQRVSG